MPTPRRAAISETAKCARKVYRPDSGRAMYYDLPPSGTGETDRLSSGDQERLRRCTNLEMGGEYLRFLFGSDAHD